VNRFFELFFRIEGQMIVSILQLMGFPVGKPVHSRAEEPPPKKPSKGQSGTGSPTDQAQERSARRQEVKAKTANASKAPTTKSKVEVLEKPAGKPASKVAVPAKSVVKPPAQAPAKPVAKSSVSTKAAPKLEPKPASTPDPKPAAKAISKAFKPVATVEKVAAKAAVPSGKPATKAVSQPIPNTRASASPAPMPVSTKSVKPIPAPVSSKSKAAVVVPPVVEKAVAAVAVPAKAGRPSSRLAQLTVPSIAQTVASTAAKASYTQSTPSPLIVPALPSSIKKDAKLANNWKTTPAAELTDAELMAMPDSEYMNTVQMAAFRAKLTKLKLDILNSAGETTEHLREDTSVVPDPADRATIEEEHALELRTRDRERKLLKKIEQSIGRIDAGDYGFCDETGEAIGVGRLLARPTATLSLEAQQRRELKQKMFGD
jgi:DnaK suppressor protein